MKYKIAVITPKNKNDYLTDTIIDGLLDLKREDNNLEFYIPSGYKYDLDEPGIRLNDSEFIKFASNADLILFMRGKDNIKKSFIFFTLTENNTDYEKADKIGRFDKTVFIDGSELGGDRRYDPKIQEELVLGAYNGRGAIELNMEKKCAMYFRREKPYIRSILPLPFGIEMGYRKHYSDNTKKDIDFFCAFGDGNYAPLRKEVKDILIDFCKKNNFTYFAEKTDKDNFYKMLARSKVGISVGGGGFDTARFWEILGNNCILLTETIDIYEPNSDKLKYERIWQFEDASEFRLKLDQISKYLKNQYNQSNLSVEYQKILNEHSSRARVLEVIEKAKEKGIIK